MITSKQELLDTLLTKYHNDPRITEQNIFNGTTLTPTGLTLFNTIPVEQLYEKEFFSCYTEKFGRVCKRYNDTNFMSYKTFNEYHEQKFNEIAMPRIKEKLDKFVGDTGCYVIWFSPSGDYSSLTITLMCPNCFALTMLDESDKQAHFDFIFD